jgi:Rgg/GadR/MutR family transcriptional activator
LTEQKPKYTENELAIGAVFKQFRLAKSFSQAEAAGGDISISQLSAFENGHTILGTNHFVKLLTNINVNLYEFENAYNQYTGKSDMLLYNNDTLIEAVLEQNPIKLEQFLQEVELSVTKNPNNRKFQLDRILIKSTLLPLNLSISIDIEDKQLVLDYLFGLKEWGLYDIRLLAKCAPLLNTFDLTSLTSRMINPYQGNRNLDSVKRAKTRSVLDIINIFVEHKEYHLANQYISYLEQESIPDYFLNEKLRLVYDQAKLHYQQGDKEALSALEKCLETWKFCNCLKIANVVSQEIQALKDNTALNA